MATSKTPKSFLGSSDSDPIIGKKPPKDTQTTKAPTIWDILAGVGVGAGNNGSKYAPSVPPSSGVGFGFDPLRDGVPYTKPAATPPAYTGPVNPAGTGPGPNGSPVAGMSLSQLLSGGLPAKTPTTPAPRYTPSGGGTTAVAATPVELQRIAQDRQMMSQQDWMTKYGNVNFDINAIKSIFDAATNAEYAAKDREYAATERKFYDQKGTEQQSLLDAKRRAAAQNAVQTGANRGMQNAMQLTDTIQQSAAAAPDALALAEGRRALIDQQQAALTLNAKEAEALAEQRKLDYAKVGSEIYATDAQKYVGELGYDAAALESAMTKYGIDRSHGGGAQQITQPTVSQASIIQQQGAYRQLYAKAQASGDTATAQMAASMLGLLAMQAGG